MTLKIESISTVRNSIVSHLNRYVFSQPLDNNYHFLHAIEKWQRGCVRNTSARSWTKHTVHWFVGWRWRIMLRLWRFQCHRWWCRCLFDLQCRCLIRRGIYLIQLEYIQLHIDNLVLFYFSPVSFNCRKRRRNASVSPRMMFKRTKDIRWLGE